VVDVESTCWKGSPPPGEVSEIIEVGIALVGTCRENRRGEVIDFGSYLVKPAHSVVSEFCTSLTGITQTMVDSLGEPFIDVCQDFMQRFKSHQRVWTSRGDYDRTMFESEVQRWYTTYPFSKTHINLKSLFALQRGFNKEVGMSEALSYEGLKLAGQHHRGGDDAKNIAKLVDRILWRYE
jgi:inhibitor of KinA sporulation pathway (predicted exonuclease)